MKPIHITESYSVCVCVFYMSEIKIHAKVNVITFNRRANAENQ